MKRVIFTFIAISGLSSADAAVEEKKEIRDQGFYLKVGSGASFSTIADISTNPSVWDPAYQGYNASLGTAPIVLAGVGYDSPFVSTDIAVSYRPNFTYRKFQTPTTNTTVGTLGQTTRKFDLDISSFMWTVYLNGRGCNWLNWKVGESSSVFPVIGGGVGVSQLKIFNFRSTGLPPVDEPFPAFASENQYSQKYEFTYQLLGGFEFRYQDLFALSLGYRWFDVAEFKGPRYLRDAYGNALDVGGNPWKISFAANEAFIEFKMFL